MTGRICVTFEREKDRYEPAWLTIAIVIFTSIPIDIAIIFPLADIVFGANMIILVWLCILFRQEDFFN